MIVNPFCHCGYAARAYCGEVVDMKVHECWHEEDRSLLLSRQTFEIA